MDSNEVKFTSKIIKTDVTAVKFLKNDIFLAGIGHVAYAYKQSNQEFLMKSDIFNGQRIHGFVPTDESNLVSIFGGKLLKIYEITSERASSFQEDQPNNINVNILCKNKQLKCSDWIVNSIWIQNEEKIAILTAHNVIQIWKPVSDSLVSYQCEEKCILYSGLLTEMESCVLAMSGTAFSQVVLWSTQSNRVLHRISGHKGVIFSICYSRDKNVIVTTSDDRSVRIWKISSCLSDSVANWSHPTSILPLATLYGHTARVIQCILQNNSVISIGEDGIMCAWELNGNLINKKKIVQGGGLWCLDYDAQSNTIVTGGSNSGVTLHREFCDSPVADSVPLDFPIDNLTAKKVALTARGNIFCLTEEGFVMYYDFEMEEWSAKHEISYSKTYLSLSVSLCKQFVALAGVDGQIDIFAENCKFDPNLKLFISQKISNDKILSVHWVNNRCLTVCDSIGTITLWGFQNELGVKISSFNLPKCKERWLTAAALEPRKSVYLLAGDRCGNFHLFKKGNSDPLDSLSKVHGRMGINYIDFHQNNIVTTGRDGSIKYFSLSESQDSSNEKLKYLHQVKVPFEWVERFFDRDRNMVCGFQETNLIVWDTKEQANVLSANCGGGHRSWDLTKGWQHFQSKKQNIFRFIYIKNSTVQVIQSKYQEISFKCVVQGFHCKEINDIKVIPPSDIGSNYYLISAGEDTSIQVASVKSDCIYKKKLDLAYHLSSIRSMCITQVYPKPSDIHKQVYILYSAGGRAQICASKITLERVPGDEPLLEFREFGNYMLKGTDFQRRKIEGDWSKLPNNIDVETRFMSLENLIFEHDSSESKGFHILLAGCSDGMLRVYKSTIFEDKCDINIVSTLKYHKRCILKVRFIKRKNFSLVLTLAVDGTVAFWNFTQYINFIDETNRNEMEPFYYLKIHKAGINSVDINLLGEDKIVLVTGGDDNILNINILRTRIHENQLFIDMLQDWSNDSYHCSQITGVKLCDEIILSASIDQRVTVLKWGFDDVENKQLFCKYVGQYHSTVPDLQGFQVIDSNSHKISLCLFGKGIEILTVEL